MTFPNPSDEPPARGPGLRTLLWLQRSLLVVGAVLVGASALLFIEGRIRHRADLERLRDLRAATLARGGERSVEGAATVAAPDLPEPGALVGALRIPRLGVEVAILAGTEPSTLRRGAGLIAGTALPGQPGNVGIAAHRDGHFRALQDVRPGERIEIVTPDAEYVYLAERVRIVAPEAVEVLDPDAADLTLVTCYPFYLVGEAPERFVLHARREPSTGPAPGPGGTAVNGAARTRR